MPHPGVFLPGVLVGHTLALDAILHTVAQRSQSNPSQRICWPASQDTEAKEQDTQPSLG